MRGVTQSSLPSASRIVGPGPLLRRLRGLIRQVDRYCLYRAASDDERFWAAQLSDALDQALTRSLEAPGARGSLAAADRRAAVSSKTNRSTR